MERCTVRFWLLNGTAVYALLSSHPAAAQIVPDATLPVNSVVTQQENTSVINGGTTAGTNLFHSFSEFGVPTGGEAFFNNATQIQNILTRVTGNSVSNIDGLIRANGTANLFLLNPNGIIFGSGARLDIAGSFLATTANSLVFENGLQFSATNPQAPPLLAINVTPGLQYGTNPPSAIANAGNLSVGQNLTLAAGLLDLQGQLQAGGDLSLLATDTVQMRDTTANAFIAKAGGLLLVQGDRKLDISALNHPQSGLVSGAAMLLRSANPVQGDAHYTTGGSFRIEQLDGTSGDLSSPGDPIIRAGSDVSINTYQGASLHIFAGGQVNLGAVTITGADVGAAGVNFVVEDVTLSDGTQIVINGGTQPTLDVRAGMNPAEIDTTLGLSGVFGVLNPANPVTQTRTSADINIGSISINAPNGLVFLTNQYRADPSLPGGAIALGTIRTDDTSGGFLGNSGSVVIDARGGMTIGDRIDASSSSGNAGNITLIARDSIALDNSFLISDNLGVGQGGDIIIRTGSLFASNGAQIRARTLGQGNAGQVTIIAADRVSFDGISKEGNEEYQRTGVINTIEKNAEGDSGGIFITTGSLSVLNGAQLQSRVKGKGTSGGITIIARDTVSIAGVGEAQRPNATGRRTNTSAVITSIEPTGVGQAGNITVQASSVALTRGGTMQSNTLGVGNAGNVRIDATGEVLVDGIFLGRNTQILTRVNPEGTGNAGDIDIKAASVVVSNDSRLIASNESQQNLDDTKAGNIHIRADSVAVTTNAQMRTKTAGRGDAGRIEIEASETTLVGEGITLPGEGTGLFANTEPGSSGSGGDVMLTTGELLVRDGAEISLDAQGSGDAGNLDITARSIELDNKAKLTAETASGNGGNITLQVQDTLLLRQNSEISTTAGNAQAGGDGGNITIDASFIVTVPEENSDIDADAFQGKGGNINITAQGIFGIEFREERTDFSDITASSQFGVNGTVQINTPDVDPDRGLAALPTNVIEPSQLIANSCIGRSNRREGQFIITGNGGLPVTPNDPLSAPYQTYQIPTVESAGVSRSHQPQGDRSFSTNSSNSTPPTASPIVEVTGWKYGAHGEVILVAQAGNVTPHSSWSNPSTCHN